MAEVCKVNESPGRSIAHDFYCTHDPCLCWPRCIHGPVLGECGHPDCAHLLAPAAFDSHAKIKWPGGASTPPAVVNTYEGGIDMGEANPAVNMSGGDCFGCELRDGSSRCHHDVVFTDSRTGNAFCHECVSALVSWEMDGEPEPDESPYPIWIGEREAENGEWKQDAKGFWTYEVQN